MRSSPLCERPIASMKRLIGQPRLLKASQQILEVLRISTHHAIP